LELSTALATRRSDKGINIMANVNTELLEALKIAFCYMPEKALLTEQEYAGSLVKVKSEVDLVRNVLVSNGINPDVLYGEMNPAASRAG
jgi:hypothetical protein